MIFALFGGAACQTQSLTANTQSLNTAVNKSANATVETASASPAQPENTAQTVSFDAPDSVKIRGTFYAAAQENSPAVLMLHQFGSNRASYKDLAAQFQGGRHRGFGD